MIPRNGAFGTIPRNGDACANLGFCNITYNGRRCLRIHMLRTTGGRPHQDLYSTSSPRHRYPLRPPLASPPVTHCSPHQHRLLLLQRSASSTRSEQPYRGLGGIRVPLLNYSSRTMRRTYLRIWQMPPTSTSTIKSRQTQPQALLFTLRFLFTIKLSCNLSCSQTPFWSI